MIRKYKLVEGQVFLHIQSPRDIDKESRSDYIIREMGQMSEDLPALLRRHLLVAPDSSRTIKWKSTTRRHLPRHQACLDRLIVRKSETAWKTARCRINGLAARDRLLWYWGSTDWCGFVSDSTRSIRGPIEARWEISLHSSRPWVKVCT